MSDITCPHYFAKEDSKRCRSFRSNGTCTRPDYLMCTEWEKANDKVAAKAARVRNRARGAEVLADLESRRPGELQDHLITKKEVASWREMGATVKLQVGEDQELFIVPDYTDRDRDEISIEHAVALAMICRAFPDSKVAGFYRGKEADDE
ncbi:MAG: hypothetical protein JRD89_18195 [Deltaproteobacteria bacterium]|nr:hypothetical protein [Deltaproteobacteria bacterium]